MREKNKLEKELYEESDSGFKNKNGLKDYTKMSSVLGGLFFSGAGYTVAATGSLIRDIASSLYSELPKLFYHISSGMDPNFPSYFSDLISSSLTHANQMGGIGAAVGMVGGTLFFGKLRNSLLSIFRR